MCQIVVRVCKHGALCQNPSKPGFEKQILIIRSGRKQMMMTMMMTYNNLTSILLIVGSSFADGLACLRA